MPEARRPDPDPVAAWRRTDRPVAVRGVPVAPRAIDQRDRGDQPAREVLFRVERSFPRGGDSLIQLMPCRGRNYATSGARDRRLFGDAPSAALVGDRGNGTAAAGVRAAAI